MKRSITLKEYESIYRIVSSLAIEFGHGIGRSCQLINVNAAFILCEFFRIEARPVMGAAFIRIDDESGETLVYAGQDDGRFYSSPDAFHCWIETPWGYFDFTAPDYGNDEIGLRCRKKIARYMFQKPRAAMSDNPYCMKKSGDFHFQENAELTQSLLSALLAHPFGADFAKACIEWYGNSKKRTVPSINIMNELGEIVSVKLARGTIVGAW